MGSFLLVPGCGGTQLGGGYGEGHYFEPVWLNWPRLLVGDFSLLTLPPTGSLPPAVGKGYMHAGPLLTWYYQPFADAMRHLGWEVSSHPYDWRLRTSELAPGLKDRIVELAAEGPVKIVCHSRGGLIVAAAVELLRAAGKLSAVERVLCLGVPWRGSYCTLPWLSRVAVEYVSAWALLAGVGPAMYTRLIRGMLFDVCITLPGVYEMTVDPAYATARGDTGLAAVYDPQAWIERGIPVSAAHLLGAYAKWSTYTQPLAGLYAHCIAGIGFDTLCGPFVMARFPALTPYSTSLAGDSTVLATSAILPGVPYTRIAETHCGMLESAFVQNLVNTLLSTPLPGAPVDADVARVG